MNVISKDGTSIAYDQAGEGASVILVDGGLCSRAFGPMPALAVQLTRHFTVFTYDRRGRNESGDTLPFAVDREIEDLEALVEVAGGAACVCAMSSGGALTLRAAASGVNLKKLALYEVPFSFGEEARLEAVRYTAQLHERLAAGRRGDAVELFMTRVGTPPEVLAGLRQTPLWGLFESLAPTLAYDNAAMGDGLLPTNLVSSVAVPTLVMSGSASPPFMHTAAQALANALPNGQYRTLEGQTHDPNAEVLAPVLVEFFAGQ